MENYIEINKKAWNQKTPVHIDSKFYDNESFLAGKNTLNKIELDLLGDISGKSILHLQCHFGQDTITLARLGAKSVGVDFSDAAIDAAKSFAEKTNADAKFVCCNIYDLKIHLNQKFDIVFSSYGTIGWLNDIDAWAKIVAHYLKPGGKFVFVEFHPLVWMYDNDLNFIEYTYHQSDPIIENMESTYSDRDKELKHQTVGWNHSLSSVVQALIDAGLIINNFQEYNYSPYNVFAGMEQIDEDKFQVKKWNDKVPLVYSIKAEKND